MNANPMARKFALTLQVNQQCRAAAQGNFAYGAAFRFWTSCPRLVSPLTRCPS